MEIVWSRWSRTSGAWSEPVALTANSYLDHAPLLCGPMANGNVLAVWTKNEANLLMGTNAPGNDTVLWASGAPRARVGARRRCSWTAWPTGCRSRWPGAGNHAVYAWTRDADGVLTNDTDQEVFFLEYTNGVWGAARQFTTNTVGRQECARRGGDERQRLPGLAERHESGVEPEFLDQRLRRPAGFADGRLCRLCR